jgi:tetratricopeptide (TPR) repeat protein
VDLRPESDRNWSQLGNFFVYAGRYADARAAYQRVIDLRPDLNRGYEALAAVFLSEGRFHEAITLYERLPHGVTSAVIASNVATAYFLAGRLDEALRNYLLSVSLEPRVAALRANLGDCYLRMRRPEEARIQYREAVRLNEADLQVSPDDPALHAQYIMHLAKAGDCAASAAAYRTHRTMLPDRDAEIQHMLARAFALCGRDGDAVAALGKMVALGASSELFRSEDEFISLRADSAFRSLVNGSRR